MSNWAYWWMREMAARDETNGMELTRMRVHRVVALVSAAVLGAAMVGCGVVSAGMDARGNQAPGSAGGGGRNGTKPVSVTSVSSNATSASGNATSTRGGGSLPSLGIGATGPQVLALNERLAELGYLPVVISTPSQPTVSAGNLAHPADVPFTWKYADTPAGLKALWNPRVYTELTRGAIIAVEHQNGLAVDGIAGPEVWRALLNAAAKPDDEPLTYVSVTKDPSPERLQVWQNGRDVYDSIANTGVHGATTTDGNFAIYLRYSSQTMTGTNPNGTHYSDPGVPDVNYFNGSDAIHGFVRADYGYPQSDGCVELPVLAARNVWALVHYGTWVTVTGRYEAGGAGSQAASGSTVSVAPHSSGSSTSAGAKSGTGNSNTTGSHAGSGNGNTTTNNTTGNKTIVKNDTLSTNNSTSNNNSSSNQHQ